MINKKNKSKKVESNDQYVTRSVVTIISGFFLRYISDTLLANSETNGQVTAQQSDAASTMALFIRWFSIVLIIMGLFLLAKGFFKRR